MPPWTSLVDLLLVPLAKSIFSTSATLYPRATASRATPAPVTPPPITRTSNCSLSRRERLCARTDEESGCIIARSRRYERAKQGSSPYRMLVSSSFHVIAYKPTIRQMVPVQTYPLFQSRERPLLQLHPPSR